jgi:rhodanese-related sulfurtransferase
MITPAIYRDITLTELEEIVANNTAAVVVDVREPWEFEEFNVGGVNIPLAEIRERRSELTAFEVIIVVCTNGTRSKVAAKDYCRAEVFRQKQILHLKGGILEVEE